MIKRLEEIERGGDVTGLSDDAIKVYKPWEKDKGIFNVWSDPEYKGCCQEAMNSHYYAARSTNLAGLQSGRLQIHVFSVDRLTPILSANFGCDIPLARQSATAFSLNSCV